MDNLIAICYDDPSTCQRLAMQAPSSLQALTNYPPRTSIDHRTKQMCTRALSSLTSGLLVHIGLEVNGAQMFYSGREMCTSL